MHKHMRAYSVTQMLVMLGPLPTPLWGKKEELCSLDDSGSGCLRGWWKERGTLLHCGTVHYPYPSVCISIVPAWKDRVKASSNGQRLSLLRILYHVSAHLHIGGCCMTHIGAEWEQRCYSGFNGLPCHLSYFQLHVEVAGFAGRDWTVLGWPAWPGRDRGGCRQHMPNTTVIY